MAELELKGLEAFAQTLDNLNKDSRKNLSRAINYGLRRTRTQASKRIREQIALKAASVNKKLTVGTATPGSLTGHLKTQNRGQPLSSFGARQLYRTSKKSGKKVRAGVSVKVKPGASPRKMRSAFFVGPMIAVRTGQGRSAYEVLYGPSVSQVFDNSREEYGQFAEEQMLTEFDRLMIAGLK
ncbi:phage tail protein [Parendozoicomonas sp. Alg238-R29]|uniref:phage tail protein n=1 Tax=Parendozoicomonas sp. Alg238-R29 TaxID=2993446 RepID=UPI00248EA062|nr:phage tail protein [Parendozoicomonas sp. Alg238-R29]